MSSAVTRLGSYVAGEIPEPWVHQFLDADGNIIDLTGYTVRVAYKVSGGAQVVRTGTLNTDGTDGKVRYAWVAGDFATAGHMTGELTVGNGTNRFAQSFLCVIVDPLGGTLPAI